MFAVALLCAGQSSTLTGTMAGQIVMEGFLNFRMRPWLRRLITRMVAVVPAALTIYYSRREGHVQAADPQPGDPEHATAVRRHSADPVHQRPDAHGQVRQSDWVRGLAWMTAVIIVGLNIKLVISVRRRVGAAAGDWDSC